MFLVLELSFFFVFFSIHRQALGSYHLFIILQCRNAHVPRQGLSPANVQPAVPCLEAGQTDLEGAPFQALGLWETSMLPLTLVLLHSLSLNLLLTNLTGSC